MAHGRPTRPTRPHPRRPGVPWPTGDSGVDGRQRRSDLSDPLEIAEAGELPPHVHPSATERYEVVSGTLHVLEGDRWSVLFAGQSHEVPPGPRTPSRRRVVWK